VLTPGLVNAHTHLALSALNGLIEPMPLTDWLQRVVAAMSAWTAEDFEASAALGARQSLLCGVTTVGDIAYTAAEMDLVALEGVGGVFYSEVLGIGAEELSATLARLGFPAAEDTGGSGGGVAGAVAGAVCARRGLSPHSAYGAGPALLAAVHDAASRFDAPVAIHVAESSAESELMAQGTGPLGAVAGRVALGFRAPGVSVVRYLASLGVLDGVTAVHLGEASAADLALIATSGARGAVACPRSNRYLGNRVADVPALLRSGVTTGIGTDSSASNQDLDVMADVRALAAEYPALSSRDLAGLVTSQGASAIGAQPGCGTLAPGAPADLAVFALGDVGDDPEGAFVRGAGAATLRAVASAGVWRVRDGALVSADRTAQTRAAMAAEKALRAIRAAFPSG
jgi:5-methylthioadenosine/S-adenosylhomocysteine deaminase